jgi:cytochrome c-type biogenesis protein CcmH/NrfG
VRLDPSHAPSWTGLAEITVLSAQFGMIPAREACATARKALSIAAGLQGESAEALHVEAFAAFIERKWPEMEDAWRRAIELQPTHVLALGSFGIVLCARGRLDEALPIFKTVFAHEKAWVELVPRLAESELLQDDPVIIKKILAMAP